MKQNIFKTLTVLGMFLFAMEAWADPTVTIKKQLNGVENNDAGTATSSISNGKCTLTVTPTDGNYVTSEFISAFSAVTGDMAHGRTRAPGLDTDLITVTCTTPDAAPSGETKYEFEMPTDGSNVEVTVNFQSRKTLTLAMVSDIEAPTYTGAALTPTVTVTDGNVLTDGTHYTVAYSNNTNAGNTAKATITGLGIYAATPVEKTFTINPKSIETATVSAVATQTYTYTGDAITPNATVSIMLTEGAAAAEPLTAGTDYTITGYANNTNAATADSENAPTITITGKGNFTGTATCKFTIGQADLDNVEISTIDPQPYTGFQITPAVTVTFNGKAVDEEEYTVSYGENINPGENAGSVTLTSTNKNFSTATRTVTFKINDILYDLWIGGERVTSGNKDNVLASAVPSVIFDGTSTLTLNEAYITSNGLNGIESGLATLTVDIVGNSVIECSGATDAAFKGTGSNKAIVFTRDPDEYGSITVKNTISPTADPINGLTTSFENNLGLLYSATNTEYTIEKLSAPEIERTATTEDGVTVAVALPDGDKYSNSTMYYTITYKDGTVDETAYTDAFTMSKPGTVTARLVSNLGGESENAVAKYYGYPDAPYTLAIDDEVTPAIYPAIIDGDLIDFKDGGYASANEAIATFTNGKITATGAGYVTVTATLTGSDMAFIVLNPQPNPNLSEYPINITVSVGESLDNIFAAGQTYGTYCNTSATTYKVPDGIKAYIVTGVSNNKVTLAETKVLPPNTAILLERGENATVFTYTAATDADGNLPSGNLLRFAANAVSTSNKAYYILYKDEFLKATGNIPTGKCYLDLTGVAAARASYGISHGDGDNTGIKDVMLDERQDGKWYDLQGRHIDQPTKPGLYILNGKKTTIKKQ